MFRKIQLKVIKTIGALTFRQNCIFGGIYVRTLFFYLFFFILFFLSFAIKRLMRIIIFLFSFVIHVFGFQRISRPAFAITRLFDGPMASSGNGNNYQVKGPRNAQKPPPPPINEFIKADRVRSVYYY